MPELHCCVAAGETGEVGGRAVTCLNITEQVKRPKQSLLPSFFCQVPTLLCRFSYLSSNLHVMPEVIPGKGPALLRYLPQTAQPRNLHINFWLFWETKNPDWSKITFQ